MDVIGTATALLNSGAAIKVPFPAHATFPSAGNADAALIQRH
jgi:hypothetical protein